MTMIYFTIAVLPVRCRQTSKFRCFVLKMFTISLQLKFYRNNCSNRCTRMFKIVSFVLERNIYNVYRSVLSNLDVLIITKFTISVDVYSNIIIISLHAPLVLSRSYCDTGRHQLTRPPVVPSISFMYVTYTYNIYLYEYRMTFLWLRSNTKWKMEDKKTLFSFNL